jgi:predicted O-methyltransferase YrrM
VGTNTKDILFKTFRSLDWAGLHALPKHYYSPVPDCTWLRENRDLWIGRSSMTGIAWNLADQFAWLRDLCEPYYDEMSVEDYRALSSGYGPGYGEIEAQVLHCFMRTFAPERVIEIGSGASTLCMVQAARLNESKGKTRSRITCIEPYPSDKLRNQSEIELIPQVCQQVPLSVLDQLRSGDFLFIDSSHAVKVGSDVLRIYLEMIPRLTSGVFIHVHDIYLPYAYPRTVFTRPWWWQETAMLMALLINNPKLQVLACESALHYDYPEELQTVLKQYFPAPNDEGLSVSPEAEGHYPSSIWLRTV